MIGWLIRLWRNRPDKAWKPTGIRQVFTGHDPAKSRAGYLRSQSHTPTGRRIVQPGSERVTPLRRSK